MRKFIDRALAKLEKLGAPQVHALISDLATENDRLDAVLDSLSDGILVSDAGHRLVMFNKSAERLVPFDGSDGYDRILWATITDEEISRFIERTLTGQESVRDHEFTL
ncbi:MAG: PAS domain-containing protein [Spirochaetales bacterium]|nr:MAG: PAS domain-containing protein [Spirochaetales bacterium]